MRDLIDDAARESVTSACEDVRAPVRTTSSIR